MPRLWKFNWIFPPKNEILHLQSLNFDLIIMFHTALLQLFHVLHDHHVNCTEITRLSDTQENG